MNANELADVLMSLSMMEDYEKQEYGRAAATMLRQQQARIEELEEQRDQALNLLKEYQK